MAIKVAINGFGRIGRPAFRKNLNDHHDLEVVAINDLADTKTLAHLLKYDSVYGIYNKPIEHKNEGILVGKKEFKCLAEKDPAKLPWKELEVDIVLECTGLFTDLDGARKHMEAGAKKVIISALTESREVPTYVLGVNQDKYISEKEHIVSMASCTTNCLAPIAKVLNDNFKITRGFMTTAHSYTNDQRLLDLPHKDLRRARAVGLSIIPTTTGAVVAVAKTIPELEGKLDGIALRVPTPVVSIVDLVVEVEKPTSVQEVNYTFKKASRQKEMDDILAIEDAELVSIDYRGNHYSAIVDASYTMVIDGTLIKVLAWYDNEWGYACRLAELTEFIGKKL